MLKCQYKININVSINFRRKTMNIGNETEYVEFKKSVAESKQGIVSMSAILNKHGKGTLYFGVKDNGDVLGQQIGKDTLNKLSQDIANNIKPSCYYEINKKRTNDEKDFIEVIFNGFNTPYSAYGRYYLRFHDEDRQMDNDVLRSYYLDQRDDYSKWEKENSFVDISKIDENLLKNCIARANEKRRINYQYSDKKTILNKLGLLYDKQYLNNAGNVLFSKEKPIQFKLAVFASESRLTILNIEIFSGNVFECIEKGMNYYSANIRWKADFVGSVQRIEEPEIPLVAIREILVNAFGHGDYNSNTDFEMDIYSDRVCIYSPGRFPKPYSPEMFATSGLEPVPLNVLINDVLYKDGVIEKFSTGFERTFDACEKAGIRYGYTETANGFRFTFYRNSESDHTRLTKTDLKVIVLLKENNRYTAKQLSEKCQLTERTINRSLRKLKNEGQIERIGSNKNGYWRIVE